MSIFPSDVAQELQLLRIFTGKNPVLQGLVGDPPLFQLSLEVFVSVEAKLGVIRKIGTEL